MPNEETDNEQILSQQEVVPTIPTQGDKQADYFSGDAWKRASGSPEEIQAVIAGLKKFLAVCSQKGSPQKD